MLTIKKIVLLFLCLFLFSTCKNKKQKPDVSHISITIQIKRFEKDLFSPQASDSSLVSFLNKEYGSFWNIYTQNIIGLGNPDNAEFPIALKHFLNDPNMKELYEDCIKKYPDLSQYEKDLSRAFQYYTYYFPEKAIPYVVSYISGFSLAMATLDSTLGIGLDMYLGSNYEKYPFHEYQKMRMNPENMVPDCMYGWISTEFEFNSDKDDLLSHMIYEGKIMYLLDLLLPDAEDSLKIAYSKSQIEWCKQNEETIWNFLIDNQLLYSTDKIAYYKKFFSPAPFTSGFSHDSPSRLGVWMGWQIVKSYMKHHDEVSIAELVNEKDAQKILKESKYKP